MWAHAILMTLAFAIFLPTGILLARYGKRAFPNGKWFYLHLFVQALSIIVVAVALGLTRVFRTGFPYAHKHHVVGILTAILTFLSPLIGVIRPHAEPTTKRKFWYLLHSNIGRAAVIFGWTNIYLGLKMNQPYAGNRFHAEDDNSWERLHTALTIIAIIAMGIIILTILFMEMWIHCSPAARRQKVAAPAPDHQRVTVVQDSPRLEA